MTSKRRKTTPAKPPESTKETVAATVFSLTLSEAAQSQVDLLAKNDGRKHRKVLKTLGLLTQNPRYPGLNSHKWEAEKAPGGQEIWESYVENNTPGAYRVFWFYGPESGVITVTSVIPHP